MGKKLNIIGNTSFDICNHCFGCIYRVLNGKKVYRVLNDKNIKKKERDYKNEKRTFIFCDQKRLYY